MSVLISLEIIPQGVGIGTIASLIGCIAYPILMMTIVAWFDFRNDIFYKLGIISFEVYLVGRVGKYIGVAVASNAYVYYTVYIVVIIVAGFILKKISAPIVNKLLKKKNRG
ncbi:MAG: hypothetical protein LUG23_05150 [Oscillospiraceae bacterium]|nr:hypothetical protein [Oscillospiraceae bacterium]